MTKQFFFISVFLLIVMQVSSQELSRSGQSYIKFFQKNIDKLKTLDPKTGMAYENELMKAEKNLKNLKVSDPSYDQSSFANELEGFKKKLNQTQSENEVADQKEKTLNEELDKFLYKKTDGFNNAKSEQDITKLIQEVDSYEKDINGFVQSAGDQSSNMGALHNAEDGWKTYTKDDSEIFYSKKNAGKESDPINAKAHYYKMKLICAKWTSMSKIFPKSDVLMKAAKAAEEALQLLGSAETLAKKAEETKAANLANVKMEASVINDPALEAEIKKAIGNSKFGAGKQVVKINILNKNWNIKRNELTNVILSRSRNFSAVVKEKDGSCTLIQYTSYKQDYVGGAYGSGYVYMGQTNKILCENAK